MKQEFPDSFAAYRSCRLCPRGCGTDRTAGALGYCGETADLRIASASIHRGEEPPVTGNGGSGTVFITGCTLGCTFCQNWQISQCGMGRVTDSDEFAGICLKLQAAGAENVNIVTGSHAVPAIAEGIKAAREKGLGLPVLWNSSAYEGVSALDLLRDTADVFLPDLKTLDSGIAGRFFKAPDYPEAAKAAVEKMMDLRELRWAPARGSASGGDSTEVLVSGTMIRHLVLPDHLDSTREVLRWYAERAMGKALLSLMMQYTPVQREGDNSQAPGRYVEEQEYETVLGWLDEFGIEEGFYQELVPGSDWLPDFNRRNPFSSDLSLPVWHWKDGFVQ
ncbi:radical SAM protein [Breznakiella homolactica]|uniref:Radical SAM protein n=1 Tax=Breznakiella homolactica TaxID=2798577 RepID=A0A7T7XQ26_9SPIR|nr:radical SAM protein [Breznakiella homolactica]QQO10303.1 radical SAM protein [Breznakiella homolactica]